jgi:hypothetical protein
MTDWTNHHPPHDHPDFDAYLDSLTDDDIAAINHTTGQGTDVEDRLHDLEKHPSAEPNA